MVKEGEGREKRIGWKGQKGREEKIGWKGEKGREGCDLMVVWSIKSVGVREYVVGCQDR